MVIAFLQQKGGAGKTTLATNVARCLQLRGHSVLIADSDPQASALAWREASDREDMPTTVSVDRDGFDVDIAAVSKAFDYTLIDGAPRMDSRSRAAVRAAHLVIVPVQPSAVDIWATEPLVRMIKERQADTGGRPRAAFLISRAIKGTRLAEEAAGAVESLGLPALRVGTTQKIAYPEAIGAGLSVLDHDPKGSAAREIQALTDEIIRHATEAA